MKNLFSIFTIILTLAVGASAQMFQRNWQPFTAANGDFTILSPGPMRPNDDVASGNKKKGSYGYKDKTGSFIVLFQKMPKVPKKLDKYFDRSRDLAVKGVGGRLLKENNFSSNGFTGREIFVQMDYGRVERARLFFHGKRLYVVLAIVPDIEVNTEDIDRYISSFKSNLPPFK